MLQNGKIKGLIFDCYKTLIGIKTDEGSRETNERVSKWLLYQGVRIEPDRLREEYRWKIIGRLGNSGPTASGYPYRRNFCRDLCRKCF